MVSFQQKSSGFAAFTPPSSIHPTLNKCDLLPRQPTSLNSVKSASMMEQSQPVITDLFSSHHETASTFMLAQQDQLQQLQPGQTFEAVAPDTNILIGFGIVLVLSVVAANVWANEVVPVSRTKLAISKRDGEVKKYLDELKEGNTDVSVSTSSAISNSTSDEFNSGEDQSVETVSGVGPKPGTEVNAVQVKNSDDGRNFERWLFTDWLENNKSSGKPGRKKEPALPILKSAKWNSGDNPVLVTFAMMMVGVIIASVTERTGGSF
jgi:hypothetical protein